MIEEEIWCSDSNFHFLQTKFKVCLQEWFTVIVNKDIY